MEPKEKDIEKDINNYRLPKSKRTLTIPTEDGSVYTFELERPRAGARDKLMLDHNMISSKGKELEGTEVISYNMDMVNLVCKRGEVMFSDGKGTQLNIDNTLDGALFDILVTECSSMLGIGERDKYFRSSGNKQQ
jgi:hypothetical protein